MSSSRTQSIIAAVMLAVVLSSAPTAVHAEEAPRVPLEIGLRGSFGGVKFASLGSSVAAYDSGYSLGAFARFHVTKVARWLSMQTEFLYTAKGSLAKTAATGEVFGTFVLRYLEIPVLARANFPTYSRIAPYAVLGPSLGITLTARTEETGDISAITNGYDLEFVAGAGVSIDLTSKAALILEARYNFGLTDIDTGANNEKKNRAFFLTIGGGWSLYGRDSDHDGISDARDRCPREEEDHDGFEDADGCIDRDNDGDLIADEVDRCRDVPEDVDGFQDEDGCPDDDNDGDGVKEPADKCPDTPYYFPFAKNDMRKDFEVPADGCPPVYDSFTIDWKEKAFVLKEGKEITFAEKATAVMDEHKPILDDVAKAMKDYPKIRILIEAYSSSDGMTATNADKSRLRAIAVRNYLIEKGIAEDRLSAKGYGEAHPRYFEYIAKNPKDPKEIEKQKESRQRNRRIEFSLIPER